MSHIKWLHNMKKWTKWCKNRMKIWKIRIHYPDAAKQGTFSQGPQKTQNINNTKDNNYTDMYHLRTYITGWAMYKIITKE